VAFSAVAVLESFTFPIVYLLDIDHDIDHLFHINHSNLQPLCNCHCWTVLL